MDFKVIKAHCIKHDKWFALQLEAQRDGLKVVNFINLTRDEAQSMETQISETSHRTAKTLRPCLKCGTNKVGTCSHIEGLGLCKMPYSYACLYCHHLRISGEKAKGRFNERLDIGNLRGIKLDHFGNPQGSQYDLAKDGAFSGEKIAFFCTYVGIGSDVGMVEKIKAGPVQALKKKGFEVDLFTRATPWELRDKLRGASQLWILSDKERHLNDDHMQVIRKFYNEGHGLYIFGDNDPFYADANFVSSKLFATTMTGNDLGDQVIGVQQSSGSSGIDRDHPIAQGIANIYEGITIATVHTDGRVRPLMRASSGKVVTAVIDDGKHRALIDGGFTRLFVKWDTAGTDRFITNCAAWLADGSASGGSEKPFT